METQHLAWRPGCETPEYHQGKILLGQGFAGFSAETAAVFCETGLDRPDEDEKEEEQEGQDEEEED